MLQRMSKRGDDGSLILGMLAIIVVSGLLLTVLATVLGGQRNTRFDRSFEQALQVAEVGQSQMVSLIQSNPAGLSFPLMTGTTTDGGAYTVEAVKSGTTWTVSATGSTPNGQSRSVQSEIVVRPLFALSAFGKTLVDFNGGNGSDSFDSALGTDICLDNGNTQPDVFNYISPGTSTTDADTSATNVRMCRRTGLGTVATNGQLLLKGGVAERIDRAEVHNAKEHVVDPLPDATGYCSGVTETCALRTATPQKLFFYREPIELPAITACDGLSSTPQPFTGNNFPLGSAVYNLSDVTLTGATQFAGTVQNPTILCVRGKLHISTQNLINFHNVGGRLVPRPPGTLLVFVTAQGNSEVTMGNNSSVSAAIYAPNAAVVCGPQGNVYGSLVANSIDNAGGWNFHYDDALGAQTLNAPVRVQNWREIYVGAS